jgi:AraC family transcriptional regulator
MTMAGTKIAVVERQAVRVAYLRYTGAPGEPLRRFWRSAFAPWLADYGLVDCPRYGVTLDDPQRAPPDPCRFDACVELPPGLSIPDAAEATVAGGRYAVTHFKGTADELGPAWRGFLDAFRNSGARLDESRPPLEHHPRGAPHDARSGIFACELCLPMLFKENSR